MRYITQVISLLCGLFLAMNSMAADTVYTEDKLAVVVTANSPSFTIKLRSNPSTGYSWFLRNGPDTPLIQPVKHFFEPAANSKNRVGASGYEVWVFQVKPAGFTVPLQAMLRFVYVRPWDANDPGKQVIFQVTLQEEQQD